MFSSSLTSLLETFKTSFWEFCSLVTVFAWILVIKRNEQTRFMVSLLSIEYGWQLSEAEIFATICVIRAFKRGYARKDADRRQSFEKYVVIKFFYSYRNMCWKLLRRNKIFWVQFKKFKSRTRCKTRRYIAFTFYWDKCIISIFSIISDSIISRNYALSILTFNWYCVKVFSRIIFYNKVITIIYFLSYWHTHIMII